MYEEHYGVSTQTLERTVEASGTNRIDALDLFRYAWYVPTLYMLSEGALRFSQIKRRLPQTVSGKSLSAVLKDMVYQDILYRKELSGRAWSMD